VRSERIAVVRDLVDCEGRILARRGQELSAQAVGDAAARARPAPGRPLSASVVVEDVREPFGDPVYRHLFRSPAGQESAVRAVLAAELPQAIHQELRLLRDVDWTRYRHGLVTAAVSARMLLAAVGEAGAVPDLTAAALLHDLGMRHVRPELVRAGIALDQTTALEIATHPVLGGYHLATMLGRHPAVDAALGHHWRKGQGYPVLRGPPPRSVEVIAVASSFAALTQARPFRSEPYDPRGAADVLVADAAAGQADLEAVQLLVHVLRGGAGEARQVVFGTERQGHAPEENRHRDVAHLVGVG
jgi:HD-GYP domain-containing protein (c-di-GMP phosphodiesterase class II)